MSSLSERYILFAEYNQWMNEKIYASASTLSASELSQDRGAFFSSIIGTLNHVLVGDTIWLKRFAEHPSALVSLDYVREKDNPKSLTTVLYPDFQSLRRARIEMDNMINEFSNELTDSILVTTLDFVDTKGVPYKKSLGSLILHFFNHQTHHRGQVTTLLSQLNVDVGVTDLLELVRPH